MLGKRTRFHQYAAIKGISVGGEETKLLQYADNMTAVLADVSSAQALFDLLNTFKHVCAQKFPRTDFV